MKSKINESQCQIVCLQETKREHIDSEFLKKFCPQRLDNFEYLPSVGASGGILVVWKGPRFSGQLTMVNEYAITIEFTSIFSGVKWHLTTVYAPCTNEGKTLFLEWFNSLQIEQDSDWLIVGDFNLIRKPEDGNRGGANIHDMFRFNEAISNLGLINLPFKGRTYTWSNNQQSPLLERLDWFFISNSWSVSYPGTNVSALSRQTSDHVPCLITITTDIPKGKIFRFENY